MDKTKSYFANYHELISNYSKIEPTELCLDIEDYFETIQPLMRRYIIGNGEVPSINKQVFFAFHDGKHLPVFCLYHGLKIKPSDALEILLKENPVKYNEFMQSLA